MELFRFNDLLFDSDFFSDGLGSDSWDFGGLVVGLVGLISLIICGRGGVSCNLRSVSGNGWRVGGDSFILLWFVSFSELFSSKGDFGDWGGS